MLCKCGCGKKVIGKGKKYTRGHHPNCVHYKRQISETRSETVRRTWRDSEVRDRRIIGQIDSWKDMDRRKSVSQKASKLMKDRWEDTEDREVLLDAIYSEDRIRKISKTERKQFASGLRKPSVSKKDWIDTKKGGRVFCRSLWEKRRVEFYDLCPLVKRFESQPFVTPYEFAGVSRSYFPDFLVESFDGSKVLEEIKNPYSLMDLRQRDKQNAKILAGKSYCKKIGIPYILIASEKGLLGEIKWRTP